MTYEFGFEGDVLYCHLIRRMKECRLDQITKVVQKKPSIGMGEEISFRIYFIENGKEKKFPWVQAMIINPSTKEFLEDLKSRLPSHVMWEDKREETSKSDDGRLVYDLQYLPFGYAGAGLNRPLQIWIYMICFAVFIIPLIYYIYVLASGGYRIYLSDSSVTIRKAGATTYQFDDLDEVNLTRINVVSQDSWTETEVLRVVFDSKSGRRKKVVMRYDHAAPMLKELAAKGVISEDVVKDMV